MGTTPGNAINESTTGITGFTGTAFTGTAVTQHAVLVGGSTSSTLTSLSVGASNSVLQGASGADPSFTTTPQLVALGIGAAAGGSGLTFDGTNLLANYAVGTWTPTITGNSTAGVTTYSAQNGYYTRIGNLVTVYGIVAAGAATGTGAIVIGGLPFTIKNQTFGNAMGSIISASNAALVWPAGTTQINIYGNLNTTTAFIWASGSANAGSFVSMVNNILIFYFNLTYQI